MTTNNSEVTSLKAAANDAQVYAMLSLGKGVEAAQNFLSMENNMAELGDSFLKMAFCGAMSNVIGGSLSGASSLIEAGAHIHSGYQSHQEGKEITDLQKPYENKRNSLLNHRTNLEEQIGAGQETEIFSNNDNIPIEDKIESPDEKKEKVANLRDRRDNVNQDIEKGDADYKNDREDITRTYKNKQNGSEGIISMARTFGQLYQSLGQSFSGVYNAINTINQSALQTNSSTNNSVQALVKNYTDLGQSIYAPNISTRG